MQNVKPNSISGIICFVGDLDKTQAFYESLGFRGGKREDYSLIVYVNWFWIQFLKADDRTLPKNPSDMVASQFIYISVTDADETYKELISKGIKSATEPKDFITGRREVIVSDPDGYKLVFFQKMK